MSKLTDKDYDYYQKRLNELRVRLTDGLDHIKEDALNKSSKDSSGDLSGYSLHMADQASDNYDREFLLELANNEQEVLYQIDEALKRIKDKSYGVCNECTKSIPKQRLKAIPFVEYCVPCQEAIEKGHL